MDKEELPSICAHMYYKKLKAAGRFNEELLPGNKHLETNGSIWSYVWDSKMKNRKDLLVGVFS